MRPTWIIEAGIYGDEAIPLVEEIRRQGMAAEVVPHQSLKKGSTPVVGGQSVPPGACVIGYGTFPFAQQTLLHHRWIPGAGLVTHQAYIGSFPGPYPFDQEPTAGQRLA